MAIPKPSKQGVQEEVPFWAAAGDLTTNGQFQ